MRLIPQALSLIRTSPVPGLGKGTSLTNICSAAPQTSTRTAFIVSIKLLQPVVVALFGNDFSYKCTLQIKAAINFITNLHAVSADQ